MGNIAIRAENISKQYRLGMVGSGTLSHDLNKWWHGMRGKENPYLKIGEVNDRSQKGDSQYVWSLKDINFEIFQGDVVGIIGKNGAGKSTLLKLLSQVTKPTTGNFKIKGRIASLLEVGTGFHPEMTGRENIFLNGAILGMTKNEIKNKFDEIVDFSGVERYIDTPVKRYSSGMYVRLAFAVAAHLESEILIVDEVLAVGDADFQKKCLGKMGDISKTQGRTVLFVSHNMAAVKTLCNQGLVLNNGTIDFAGSANDSVNHYLRYGNLNDGVHLAERTDRYGNGKLKFKSIRFLNSQHQEVFEAISGEELTIEIGYEIDKKLDISKIILGINFRDNLAQIITSFLSDELTNKILVSNEKGKFLLKIPSLLLRGETYEIRLMAFDGDTQEKNTLDILENAAYLNVLQGDIDKAGKLNRKGFLSMMPAEFITE